MAPWRLLRLLLLLLLPAALGLAGGRGAEVRAEGAPFHTVGPTVSPPTQSLPTPVHDEATCAFCQAAIFSPCPPAAAPIPVALTGTVADRIVSPDARTPHTATRRLAESRAPPAL
ncbi:MAG TPA: hypothetical protein VIG08_06025 [Gemmatimonadales bacterium]|jgi:hypothetical protein